VMRAFEHGPLWRGRRWRHTMSACRHRRGPEQAPLQQPQISIVFEAVDLGRNARGPAACRRG
jgi:hypothetical protein